MRMTTRLSAFTGLLACLAAAGCSGDPDIVEPDLGQVTGVVKLDGEPAKQVQVVFLPEGSGGDTKNVGGISTAMTDDTGRYTLTYKDGVPGAVIGTHTVRIMRPEGVEPNADGSIPPPSGPPIPAKYGIDSTLKEEVKAGENTIDFDLTS